MKLKVKAECSLDFALKQEHREYLFSIDLASWCLFKRRDDESGYKSIKVLCITVATLDRRVFDKWLAAGLRDLLSAEVPGVESVREDVM